MNKTRFLSLVTTLLAVNIAFAADEVHWTVTDQNSVTFDWRGTTTEKTIGYGVTSGAYTQITATTPNPAPVSSSGPFWEAKLTGLKENTRYFYKIGSGSERSFRTPPAPGSSNFTVYAQGNIGSSSTYFNTGAVQDLIANDLPAFVVGLGDLTLGSNHGKATIDQHFNDVMVWSKEAAYMPVWGEMDTITSKNAQDSFTNYKGRFAVPNSQTSPGSPLAGGEDWYWFDYGNVRFITMPMQWKGAWADWNTKAGKLMAKAQADSNIKFIVTFVHRPAYSSGHYTGNTKLKGILNKLGDTYSKYKLNINAHSNNYERSLPQHGVIHVTAGTGGASLTQDGTCLWLTCAKPAWSVFRAMHLGALKLHFTDSSIEGSFICGPAGGGANDVNCAQRSVVDSFVISTTTSKPPTTFVGAAFPGAQGGGAAAVGGRGGAIIEVTNLNDSGEGSLRACVDAKGARTCVFRVGGTIQLLTALDPVYPYLTIAGQTAPGGGILLNGVNLAEENNMIRLATHDVIVRYIRIRKGSGTVKALNCGTPISIEGGGYNILVDHVSVSWNQDEGIGIWSTHNIPIHNVTLSWNLTAEGLAAHSTGLLLGSDDPATSDQMTDIDSHHSLIMNNSHRNPLIKIKSFRYVNNIIYNWNYYSTMIGQGVNIDLIGNLYKPGPLNSIKNSMSYNDFVDPYEIEVYPVSAFLDQATGAPSIYTLGNKGPHNTNPDSDNWVMFGKVSDENGMPQGALSASYKRTSPMSSLSYPIVSDPVENLESIELPTVGASQKLGCDGSWVANRDSVDTRLINQYQTNTGNSALVIDESQVGGFPIIEAGTACTDTDHDGMPDLWETEHGLNTNNAEDRNTIAGNGYTNVENFLNGM